MNTVCAAAGLTRIFRSGKDEIRAVDNVTFSICAGETLAVVGLNGAGKTTLLRMCSTLLEPTSGSLQINGVDACAHPYLARRSLGISFGGDRGFYPKASVRDNLLFFADLAEVPNRARHKEVSRVISLVDLADKSRVAANTLSRGQYQRLHIARALLGDPRLIILDEPTYGLDPYVALQLRSLLASIAANGTALLLSSHSMEEVAELANRVLLMRSSHIISTGSVADVIESAGITRVSETILSAAAHFDINSLPNIDGLSHVSRRPQGSRWLFTAYWSKYSKQSESVYLSCLLKHQTDSHPPHIHRDADLQDAFLFLSEQGKQ